MENKMQFYNPNEPVADEYIENLQQQLHFMDLEFKILREKVMEDEKKSNIGSLYDDDKTSHQHISLLKNKYAKMLKDFHRTMTQLQKQQLEVQGESFVLQAHINISKTQNADLKNNLTDYQKISNANVKEMNKKFTLINTDRSNLEMEVTVQLKNDLEKTRATRFDHKMTIDKSAKVEEIRKYRHDRECYLLDDLIKRKNEEKADLVKRQADQDAAYQNHAELQAAISETNDLRAKIEIAKVQIMQKQIEIGLLQDTTEALNRKKEELLSEKQDSELKNEELKQQLKAQEDVAHKRLMNRLNQHKTQEIKELLIQQESLKEFNEQLTHKLHEEKEKFDQLMDLKITKDEEKRLLELQLAEDTQIVDD